MSESSKKKKWKKLGKMFAGSLWQRTDDAMVLRVASSLSYTTLLAVVPFIAVALAIFAELKIFADVSSQVQDFLFQYFVPDIGQNIPHYIRQFVSATSKLKALGIAGLAVTAFLMLYTIESSFNFIFDVKKRRKIVTRICLYAAILIICPLLLGLAFSIKGYLLTLKYFHPEEIIGYGIFAGFILPNLMTILVMMLSYYLVPNRKVKCKNAFIGACVAFLMMYVLRFGFGYFLALNVTYKTLYGALAAVPLMLVWMYSWWAVVMFGAVVTATCEEFSDKKYVLSKIQKRKAKHKKISKNHPIVE